MYTLLYNKITLIRIILLHKVHLLLMLFFIIYFELSKNFECMISCIIYLNKGSDFCLPPLAVFGQFPPKVFPSLISPDDALILKTQAEVSLLTSGQRREVNKRPLLPVMFTATALVFKLLFLL